MQGKLFDIVEYNPLDVVMTPKWCAEDIVSHFAPSGRVLDPCKGDGAFWSLIDGCEWCEIREGRDFYECKDAFDWIVGNPPYSVFPEWLKHSMKLASQIVYLVPIAKIWGSEQIMELVRNWGGVKEIRIYGSGRKLGFPFGFACGAVHFVKAYDGKIGVTYAR